MGLRTSGWATPPSRPPPRRAPAAPPTPRATSRNNNYCTVPQFFVEPFEPVEPSAPPMVEPSAPPKPCGYVDVRVGDEELSDSSSSPKPSAPTPVPSLEPVINQDIDSNTSECIVCMDEPKEYAFTPCGHKCVCENCSSKVERNCPMCRKPFTGVIKIFD